MQLVGNRHDAEDVTQETFIRVYSALADFPPQRIRQLHVNAYVWKTLLNQCRNKARTRRRKPEDPIRGDVEAEASPNGWVEAAQVWQPRLAKLSDRQRSAVVMRHVAGLSYREIADALHVPVGTAKADVHRGLSRLRTMIEAEGEVA